jgi:hypothetical protein
MTGSNDLFFELDTQVYGTLKCGDGSVTKIEGCGMIILACKNMEHRALTYYIPQLRASNVSLDQLDETGCHIDIHGGFLQIFNKSDCLLARVEHTASHLYYLELKVGRLVCLAARASEVAWLWHARFGHLNFNSLKKIAAGNMVRSLPPLDQVDQLCDGCLISK